MVSDPPAPPGGEFGRRWRVAIIHILFEKPNLGRDILALKLLEYYYHRHMQENWIDFFKATKSTGRQEIGRGKDVKFKQTRLKAIPL